MRKLLLGIGVVLALAFFTFALEMIASENGEVIVLRAPDETGAMKETRLWVVDDGSRPWVRAGYGRAAWLESLRRAPDVEILRGGEILPVRAVFDPTALGRVNALMAEKYGWADTYVGLLFSRDDSIPVRLDPR